MNGDEPVIPTAAHARPQGRRGQGGLATGLALILVGAVFLLHNLRLFDFDFAWEVWPLILVIFGMVRMIDRRDPTSGLWLVVIGLWLFVNELGLWGFTYGDSWPLLIVAVGLSMVWKALRGRGVPPTNGCC